MLPVVRRLCTARAANPSPVLAALHAARHTVKPFIVDSYGDHTASQLLCRASHLAVSIPSQQQHQQQQRKPVAVFLPPDSSFVTSLLAAWQLQLPVVPLSPLYPAPALDPLLRLADPSCIITSHSLRQNLPPTITPVLPIDDLFLNNPRLPHNTSAPPSPHGAQSTDNDAMIFFTSGTTGVPKAVPWTHDMLHFQLRSLATEWQWTQSDSILSFLPLNHIHGLVNVVLSSLFNHATLTMHSAFDPYSVWTSIAHPHQCPSILMAVPTIYSRLLHFFSTSSSLSSEQRAAARAHCQSRLRLCVSGSAALPPATARQWKELTAQLPVERYGMTEAGMILAQSIEDRRPGFLGRPLNNQVSVRMASDGELQVRSASVFKGYLRNKVKTKLAFTSDGYFKTGDVVTLDEQSGYYKLVGRQSVDIMNPNGFKVSALEIEDAVKQSKHVNDCAVFAVPHPTSQERIVAVVVLSNEVFEKVKIDGVKEERNITKDIQQLLHLEMPAYKVPKSFIFVDELPRNVLGKVQKQILKSQYHNHNT